MKSIRSAVAASVSLILGASLASAHGRAEAATVSVSIEAKSLVDALNDWAQQTGFQLILRAEDATVDMISRSVTGSLPPEKALEMLLTGSGLDYDFVDERTVAIYSKRTGQPLSGGNKKTAGEGRNPAVTRTAMLSQEEIAPQTDSIGGPTSTDHAAGEVADGKAAAITQLEEIVVTGSHIRGVQNLSSPILRFDREDIERSGYATTQQFIQSLPQNLNSISDTTVGDKNGGTSSRFTYEGSGANLRGLGGDATLVLLNGRRLAAAGNGSFVDLSLLPLSAIERIEVLTDGASAIYGSDAVGGVLNFILREDFTGAETRIRYGSVTQGAHDERQAGQMLGHAWSSGQALISYEYFKRTALNSSDRDFFDPEGSDYEEFELIPGQKRHSALALLEQQLSPRIKFNADVFYGQRESAAGFSYPPTSLDLVSTAEQYGGSMGLKVDVANTWELRLTGLFDQSDSEQRWLLRDTREQVVYYGNESRLSSMDLALDGSLMSIAGGEVRLALGGQVRHEEFVEEASLAPTELERDISAIYAEVHIPWVSALNRRTGIENLQLTLAARYEDYTDFGSSFNPKVGLAWAPIEAVNLRATWGTSFKAPLLTQLNPAVRFATVYEDYPSESGPITALVMDGNGVNLGPEESTNWTLGIDFSSEALPGLSVSATYFDIDYDERISLPLAGYDWVDVLRDPAYESIVFRNPSRDFVQALVSGARYADCYTATWELCDLSAAIERLPLVVDGRMRNLAGVRMSGIDFSFRYRLQSSIGDWGLNIGGSHLLKNRQQLVPSAPETSELNRVWRPVDLKLRNSLSYSRGGLALIAAVNYTDDYRDLRTGAFVGDAVQRSNVASWTTVDLSMQYDLSRLWSNRGVTTTLHINATNLFDRDPPYVANAFGLYYDGVNANPLGRFLSAQVTAHW